MWRKWHLALAAAVLVVVGILVGRRMGPPSQVADAGHALESGPAPTDLLANVWMGTPNASWTRLQRGVGGAMGILPPTLPGVLLALTDFDTDLANEVDGNAPMFGAVAGDPGDPAFVLAGRLVHGVGEVRGRLLDAGSARFTGKDLPGMTLLVPRRKSAGTRLELAITDNGYLVVGRQTADLERLAPYVTVSLPEQRLASQHAATIRVSHAALANVLKPRLTTAWNDAKASLLKAYERERAALGRAPDFGDAAPIVAAIDSVVTRRLDVLADLESVNVTLDVTDDAISFDATLVPTNAAGPAGRWIETMKVGDASAVLALSAESALAVSFRDGEGEREEQAKQLEKTITEALGARLTAPNKVHDVLASITKARDEIFAASLSVGDPAGVIVRGPVRDAAAAEKGISQFVDLAKVAPFKDFLRVRDVTQATSEVAGLGRVSTFTVERDAKAASHGKADAGTSTPSNLGLAWLLEDRVLSTALGSDPVVTLRAGAKPERRLADEPTLARFIATLGSDASSVVVAQPLKLSPKRTNLPTAPLALGVGKKDGSAGVHLEINDGLIRELARWQMGF